MATDSVALTERAARLGCALGERDAQVLLAYLDAMLEANRSLSLTAIRDREDAVVLHVLDSVAAARLPVSPTRVLDLGTGNGFPGVALSILWPTAEMVLMDRTGKKVDAIEACLQQVGIERCTTVQMDAAMAPAEAPGLLFDFVAVRAVTSPAEVAKLAAPLTVPGGHLCLWQDRSAPPEQLPGGFTLQQSLDYELPAPKARGMRLLLYRKG